MTPEQNEAYFNWYKRSRLVERRHNPDGSVTETREAMCTIDIENPRAVKRIANISVKG